MADPQVGQRLRDARLEMDKTQQDIAKHLGISRAGVSQWEGGVTSPSVATIAELAKFLDKPPAWLAYGVDAKPQVVTKVPEGTVELKEVLFGDTAEDRTSNGSWSVPMAYLKSDLHVAATDGLIIWRVESDSMAPAYEYGDRIVIDTTAKRVSPPGVFLIWDGVGPNLAHIHVVQVDGAGQKAKVSTTNGGGESYEASIDKIRIIGRVRGRIHAS